MTLLRDCFICGADGDCRHREPELRMWQARQIAAIDKAAEMPTEKFAQMSKTTTLPVRIISPRVVPKTISPAEDSDEFGTRMPWPPNNREHYHRIGVARP